MPGLVLRSSVLRSGLAAAAEPLAIITAFVAFGLAWAAVLGAGEGRMAASEDRGGEQKTGPPAPRLWLVDGYNVLHAGVLRGRDRRDWWTAEVQSRLVAIAETFEDEVAPIVVVFDAAKPEAPRCPDPSPPSRVRLVYTPSADDWLVKHVRSSAEPSQIAVVTADRQVQGRARHRGATVVSPLAFLARCNRGPRGAGSASPHENGGSIDGER